MAENVIHSSRITWMVIFGCKVSPRSVTMSDPGGPLPVRFPLGPSSSQADSGPLTTSSTHWPLVVVRRRTHGRGTLLLEELRVLFVWERPCRPGSHSQKRKRQSKVELLIDCFGSGRTGISFRISISLRRHASAQFCFWRREDDSLGR